MNLTGRTLIYHIPQFPDPFYSQHQVAACGDVRTAVAGGSEHLLRALAHMPAGSCSAELLFIFEPEANAWDRQSRLNLYLLLWASDIAMGRSLDSLVRGGLLSRFYEFKRIEKIRNSREQLSASCYVIRREDFPKPLYSCDFNPKIPDRYYTIKAFTPNEKNDYLTLDRILDRVVEPVTISVRVQPEDVPTELHAHTAYLARLDAINHSWDIDEEDSNGMDCLGSDSQHYISLRQKLRPLSYKDPLATDILRAEREIHKTLLQPHLLFSIRITAETEAVARLVGSVFAESVFKKGSYRIVVCEKDKASYVDPGETCGQSNIIPFRLGQHIGREVELKEYEGLERLNQLATVDELLGVFRFPVASFSSPLCCRKNTDPPCTDEKDLIVLGYDEQGFADNSCPVPRGIHIDVLRKHFCSFGLPGVGKTTSNMNILYQLHARNIPFIVVECAKKEYRALKMFKKHKEAHFRKLAKKLEIYTPGAEKLSPFRLNPFEILQGIDVIEHIENLMSCFKASIPVSAGSLPALLGKALEKVYEDHSVPDQPPVMKDLVAAVEAVLATKGYSSKTRSDMQTAIEVRLGVLAERTIGKVFQCQHGISIKHLMKVPCVVELDRLPPEQACLLALFILNGIREYLKTISAPAKGLSYVVLIEEAHVIFGSGDNTLASEEVADTKSFVADLISRMLVELRALGVGIVLSDQHPSALDPGASKSVASKLAFRQVHSVDREELGSSMLFKDIEIQDIARLEPGEAFFFTEGYFEPRRIRTPNLNEQLCLTPPPNDKELQKSICNDKWFQKTRTMRLSDELGQLKEYMDEYDDQRKRISDHVEKLLLVYKSLLGHQENHLRDRRMVAMVSELRALRKAILLSYRQFIKGPYFKFSHLTGELKSQEHSLRDFGKSLNCRFESAIKPVTRNLLGVINKLIKKCIELKLKETDHAKKK